ncbi:glycosyltransferase family 2 protein [Herbiconiux sp. UC225_62]|uniref:glycosyltransferase family 2 protein n=1 Tax=Herbiconiux sp. UC225_62 TaxID=3350168 RepID=UPI0036D3330E
MIDATRQPQGGHVAIGIATFKRPELLRALLTSIVETCDLEGLTVFVIDNDPLESAATVCAEFAESVVRYEAEPQPGIAAARNRFLDIVGDETYLIFVDDDETVTAGWLAALIEASERLNGDVISGPVIPLFPPDAPQWAVDGMFFERARHPTGTALEVAATNNTLVRSSVLRRLAPFRFDESFSMTGGSDTDFFHRLRQGGATLYWCDDAIVEEVVPASRMTWRWVRSRAQRTGEVRARILLRDGRRGRLLAESIARMFLGGARLAILRLQGRSPNARALNPAYRGWGMIQVLRGRFIHEYQRVEVDEG